MCNNKQNIRTIILTESQYKSLYEQNNNDDVMTEWKFTSMLKSFLRDLLTDPVNATPNTVLLHHGLKRSKLLNYLIRHHIVEVNEKIIDTDNEGNPTTPSMRVKYKVPKEDFDRKIHKLFIRLFERNVPVKPQVSDDTEVIEEDGATGCEASSGQFISPQFPVQRRGSVYTKDIDEATSLSNVGDYQYDVPFPVNKRDKAMQRGTGIGGSTSIETMDNNRK